MDSVAVEDSASGVGSASNADIGFIVGYVGGSHISDEVTNSHAQMLMQGTRADNGRGAEIVISDMRDLATLTAFFAMERMNGRSRPFVFPQELLDSLKSQCWLPGASA